MNLPPYIYGREAGPNEKVWTEAAVREAVAAAVPDKDSKDWCDYVAVMIGGYLEMAVDAKEVKAISGIMQRRVWSLKAMLSVAAAVPEVRFGNMADPFTYIIQHLNSNPYSLTKDECVSLVKELRDKYLAAAPGGER